MQRVLACVFLIACGGGGGGSVEGDPLIVSSLTAEFNNKPWTPAYGFARMETNTFAFYVGDEKISCADDFKSPRDGHMAATGVATPTVGNYSNVLFDLIEVINGDLTGKGAQGTVMVTGVTDMDVSAVFGFTTTIDNGSYSLTGAVTLLRCP